jgi:hypothetical protein
MQDIEDWRRKFSCSNKLTFIRKYARVGLSRRFHYDCLNQVFIKLQIRSNRLILKPFTENISQIHMYIEKIIRCFSFRLCPKDISFIKKASNFSTIIWCFMTVKLENLFIYVRQKNWSKSFCFFHTSAVYR